MNDSISKYLTQDKTAKIHTVSLQQAWKKANEFQVYPLALKKLLGELCSATVLLASNIKFKGTVQIQLQGNGPVSLISIECTDEFILRSTVEIRPDRIIKDTDTLNTLINADHKGRCLVILDPKDRPTGQSPYIGIVPIEGMNLSEALTHYMKQSEQLETHFLLAADHQYAKGILLQRIPVDGGHSSPISIEQAQAHWEHLLHYLQTVSTEELLSTPMKDLLHRLFWEEDLMVYPAQAVEWKCTCSWEKVASMLRHLGKEEVESLLSELNEVSVQCHSCGKPYVFDPIDCASLFIENGQKAQDITQ